MRTSQDALEYICRLYDDAIDIPKLIGHPPDVLEIVLTTLEAIRRFVLDTKPTVPTWLDYCRSIGVTHNCRFVEWYSAQWRETHGVDVTEEELYRALVEHWHKYLKWCEPTPE